MQNQTSGKNIFCKNKLKVLTLTSLFPNNQQPNHGIFIKERMCRVAKLCELKVIAPVPYFPPIKLSQKWYSFSQVVDKEVRDEIEVFHPKYLVTPKIGRALYGWFYFLSIVNKVREIKDKFNFDLIDAHFVYPDGFAAILLGKVLGKPVVVSARGTDINRYPQFPLIRRAIVYTLKNATRVIAVCKALKDRIIELGIPKSKVAVVPNGIDAKTFKPIPKTEARIKLGIPLEKKIILSVGYLIERKGFHYVTDAVNEIVKKGRKDILLLIVGEGEYREKLEKQITELELVPHVQLVGERPHNELPLWYSSCDVFCLASSREGWANVLLEALACGKPCVATNIWGTPEVICSDNYGILVDKQNGSEIAKAILAALERNWDTDKIIEYVQKNSWERVAQSVFAEFEFALAS